MQALNQKFLTMCSLIIIFYIYYKTVEVRVTWTFLNTIIWDYKYISNRSLNSRLWGLSLIVLLCSSVSFTAAAFTTTLTGGTLAGLRNPRTTAYQSAAVNPASATALALWLDQQISTKRYKQQQTSNIKMFCDIIACAFVTYVISELLLISFIFCLRVVKLLLWRS